MERKAYPVDEKLFDLLLEENFDKLNTGELQKLFNNFPYEISDKWVFISDKTEREYQSESENYEVDDFFSYSCSATFNLDHNFAKLREGLSLKFGRSQIP